MNSEIIKQSRPWHLWLVAILSILWNSGGALDFTMTQMKNEEYMKSFTADQLEYFYSFPLWVVASWGVAVWGAMIAAILLLMGKKLATPIFLVALIAMVLTTIHNFILNDGLKVMGDPFALAFTATIFILAVLQYVYSRAMQNKNILN